MDCIDLTSKQSKILSYVKKHSKLRKTTKVILFRWIWIDLMSKRSKTLRYVAKLQKWSNYNELHRFDVKTIKTFELGRKTTKVIKLLWIASIWHQNNLKCGDTSQNYKSDQIIMIASTWRQNDQNVWVRSQN